MNTRIIKLFIIGLSFFGATSWAIENAKPSEPSKVEQKDSGKRWLIQHWKTPSGIPVYFIENHVLPMIDIQVVFRAGSAYDGPKFGLAYLTNTLLNLGTKQASEDQIAEQWDTAGAIYNANVTQDMAIVGMRSLTYPKQFDLALSTLKDVISYPTFSLPAFQRAQKQLTQLLQHQEQNPDVIASKGFYKALYGDHPYAHAPLGEVGTLSEIKPEEVQAFYQRYYTANNALIALVGNLSLEEAKKISIQLTDALGKGAPADKIPPVQKNNPYAQHMDFPSNQTHVSMGEVALKQGDPDFFAFTIANHMFGGNGLTSRLYKTVREAQGLAYHVSSRFSPLQEAGPFFIKLQTENSQKQKAMDLVKKELLAFMEKGPSQEELLEAQKHLIQNFVLKLSSNQATLLALIEVAFYGLPLDYLSTYQDKLQSVTYEQVKDVLKKHLSVDRFVVITVGKK